MCDTIGARHLPNLLTSATSRRSANPRDMKAEADLHFLQGINQLIGHGWPYSPPEVGEPGWRFYAAAVFNQHNPWWLVMPDITGYLQRMSFLLRQGSQPTTLPCICPPTMPGRGSRRGMIPSTNPWMGCWVPL